MTTNAGPIEGHDVHAGRLIAQAEEELAREDRLQASEKAWGAVAHQLKAIAELRGWEYEDHSDTYDIIRRLVAETGDTEMRLLFSAAAALHRNFYLDTMPISELGFEIGAVKELLAKLRAA